MYRIAFASLLLALPASALEVSVVSIDPDEQQTLERACREYDRAVRADGQTTIEQCIVGLAEIAVRDLLVSRVRRVQATSIRDQERAQLVEWADRHTSPVDRRICGDGEADQGEECDPGAGNFDSSTPDTGCRPGCRDPYCGDGVKDSGETCDPGANSRCKADCSGLAAMSP